MKSKLAGHLPLQEMIYNTIESTRAKLAAATGEKAEETTEVAEKTASAHLSASEEIEKLALALETVAEKFAGDQTFVGDEKANKGGVLPVMAPVGGQQAAKKDKSKSHNIPTSSGLQASSDNPASTQVPNDAKKRPSLHSPMPKKGVLKTAAQGVMERIQAAAKAVTAPVAEEKGEEKAPEAGVEKKSEAVEYIVNKIAEYHGGGMTLDSKSGAGPKPSTSGKFNNDRKLIASNAAATDAKKVDAKKNEKKQLAEVLTEPAMSKAHDSKVQENLRNATKGGVKIAAMKALLSKVASEGCTCDGAGSCRCCKLNTAMTKQSSPSATK